MNAHYEACARIAEKYLARYAGGPSPNTRNIVAGIAAAIRAAAPPPLPPGEVAPPTPADLGHLRDYMIRAKFWLGHGGRTARNQLDRDKLNLEAAELRRGIEYLEKFLPAKMK